MVIPHFDKIDIEHVEATFTEDMRHRISLVIPFLDRATEKDLCIIGQNPSNANEHNADKTLRYLEEFVFRNLPEYSRIIMLNLYSRVDTNKEEVTDIERTESNEAFLRYIDKNSDFLLVFGASAKKKEGAYNFPEKVNELMDVLSGKNVFKIDIQTNTNYPPHPGNPKITYSNYNYGISRHC